MYKASIVIYTLFIAGLIVMARELPKRSRNLPEWNDSIFPPQPLGFKVVGYIGIESVNVASLSGRLKAINILCYANTRITASGELDIKDPKTLDSLRNIKANNKIKLFISFLIERSNKAQWDTVNASEKNKQKFISSIMNLVRKHELDGVDIDWELETDGSAKRFTDVVGLLSDSCHYMGKYYLSAAVASGLWRKPTRDAISDTLLGSDKIDFYNIMSYDDLRKDSLSNHSSLSHAVASIWYWTRKRKMPNHKAVLGIPFYGATYCQQHNTNHKRPYDLLVKRGANPEKDTFTFTATDKDHNKERLLYHYNGKQTIEDKLRLASFSAGGVMFWKITGDAEDTAASLLEQVNQFTKNLK